MTYNISYDLNKPGQDYPDLYSAIKRLSTSYCHPVDSTWYVVSDETASGIREKLSSAVDNGDSIIVTRATAPGAWTGLEDSVSDWLKNNL